jgi:D-alanine-D-alanine ligase
MPMDVDASDLPVTMLFNLDPAWAPAERAEAASACGQMQEALAGIGHPTSVAYVEDDRLEELLARHDPRAEIVLNWCESIPGVRHSEGLVARRLEARGFVFTGSGAAALELSADKARVKALLVEQGIPTPAWQVYDRPEPGPWATWPAIVKLENEHASEGITRDSVVTGPEELAARLRHVIETYRQPALVEEFLPGREFTIGVLGRQDAARYSRRPELYQADGFHAFPALEVENSNSITPGVYGNLAKTLHEGDAGIPDFICPADVDAELGARLHELAVRGHQGVGALDVSRVDIRLDSAGEPRLIEINTLPGLSPGFSDLCVISAAQGISYRDLILEILYLGASRFGLLQPAGEDSGPLAVRVPQVAHLPHQVRMSHEARVPLTFE